MIYQPTLVTKDFYEVVKKTIPEALSEPRYARFLDHLLFSRFIDEDSGYTVSPESLLADMEDMSHKLRGKSRNYNRAIKFPEEFQETTGLILLSTPYSFKQYQAGAYALSNLPDNLREALDVEVIHPPTDKYQGVYLESGETCSPSSDEARRRHFIAQKELYMARNVNRPDIEYLNFSSRRSTFLQRGYEERSNAAREAIDRIPDQEKRASATTNLNRMVTFEPFYQDSYNSQRIYTSGVSLQNLSSTVREAILKPSKNYDLTAAQLAIMATHWDVAEIQDLVHSGEVWVRLCNSLKLPLALKDSVKRLIYSTAFGMTEVNLAIRYGQVLGKLTSDATALNTSIETIQYYSEELRENKYLGALLKGRKQAMRRLQSTKQAVDAQGQVFRASDFRSAWEGGKKLRTMMAFEMQSREKWLMEPIIELAQENEKKMLINLWLHDGVYIHYHKSDRSQKLEREMFRLVNQRAKEAGYPTTLELVAKAS
ncbi:hypothetical protein [uncultured Deinococcus sp.]|uniref:hypothetical protein n=1 Tax=uncultured Deinococcus sp. TaxID=158789 RepID=UPI00258EB3F6|nr:hypothetical protein [uncultured Deinococcus sp.]